ncbi:MAG TPA: glycoside hydrolase family 15 protein [Rhizomicrobium sp.]
MASRIEDYALIGDMRTAALVGRDGSIDWLCVPRFDSAACFAALLGTPEHGRWLLAPTQKAKTRRKYRDDTLILETTFKTAKGEATLIEFMPVAVVHSSIVRVVMGRKGIVSFLTDLVIRFDFGVTVPWVSKDDEMTLTAVAGPNLVTLRTTARLHGKDMHTQGEFSVRAGEAVAFVMTYSPSDQPVPLPLSVESALDTTVKFWEEWSGKCKIASKWSRDIRRSLITLKALSYRPTGGIVAAVTTSLPEQIGGTRNWDYRYCWIRDATFTLLAFMNAGYLEEAAMWQNWLVRAIAGSPEQIQAVYGPAGERRLDEWNVGWLPGYENSAPVRVGNAAALQLQLDVFGELADAMTQARKGGLPGSPRRDEIRAVMLGHLEKIWDQPDEGIWEIRGAPQHFTYSKAMTWVAFDRAWKANRDPAPIRKKWKRIADRIHKEICREGIDPKRKCFVQSYGSEHLDASLLLLPIIGFLPPTDSRIRNTVNEIESRLMFKDLVLRYETGSGVDGLPAGEGAFLACSFWLVDNYLLVGRRADAERLFARLVRLCNDVGLLAEEYDPRARRMLGNFPQAFSHVALVNSGLALATGDHPRRHRQSGRPAEKPVLRHKS